MKFEREQNSRLKLTSKHWSHAEKVSQIISRTHEGLNIRRVVLENYLHPTRQGKDGMQDSAQQVYYLQSKVILVMRPLREVFAVCE
jgi:hypothetical protein